MWRVRRGGPRTPSRTSIEFVEKALVFTVSIGGMPFGPPLNNPLTVTDEDDFGNTLLVKRMTWFPLLLMTGLNHLKAVMVLMINIYFKPRQ